MINPHRKTQFKNQTYPPPRCIPTQQQTPQEIAPCVLVGILRTQAARQASMGHLWECSPLLSLFLLLIKIKETGDRQKLRGSDLLSKLGENFLGSFLGKLLLGQCLLTSRLQRLICVCTTPSDDCPKVTLRSQTTLLSARKGGGSETLIVSLISELILWTISFAFLKKVSPGTGRNRVSKNRCQLIKVAVVLKDHFWLQITNSLENNTSQVWILKDAYRNSF